MNAEDLKKSILQMAVEGKLVEQDPSDEPASKLIERIRNKRQQLIKDKKIKKPRCGESVIYRKYGSWYEKCGKAEAVCIDDEIPFEIPESWEWVRLGSIVFQHPQLKPKSSFSYIDIGSIDNKSQCLNTQEKIIEAKHAPSRARKPVFQGDILYSTVRPYLHNMCIVNKEFSKTPIASTGFAVMTCHEGINNQYLFFYLLSPMFDSYANANENSKGVAYPAINDKRLYNSVIAIPPLAEQRRIVEKVEKLLPLVEEYGKLEDKRKELDASLPEKLRKSVLQMAVEGKLVEQDPSDEPANELIERIQNKRQQLIKDKKIKKPRGGESVIYRKGNSWYEKRGKSEAVCIDDEIPFEIPESWEWVRLGSIVFQHPQLKPKSSFSYIDIGSIDNKSQCLNTQEKIIEAKHAPSRARKPVFQGDILYSTVRPYLHNMCIINKEFSKTPIASTGFAVMTCHEGINNQYLFFYLLSPIFDSYANANENSKGVAYPAINDKRLYYSVIAVPPLAEQKRIVQKVDKILRLLDA